MARRLQFAAILTTLSLTLAAQAQPASAPASTAAPAPSSAAAPQRFATVDALLLVDLVLDSEPIKSVRQNKGKELDTTFRASQRELMDLEAKLMTGAKDDPKREGMIKEWEVKKKTVNDLQASLSAEFDKFNSQKAAEAWTIVTGKIDQLATQNGYTHVHATRRERSFTADTQAGTVQQLLSRQLILFPAADDLTDKAIALMNLQTVYEEKKAEEARQAAERASHTTPVPLTVPNQAPNPAPAQPEKKTETSLPKSLPGTPAPK